jgi:hypothetical protein
MTEGGVVSTEAKTGDVGYHVFSDRGVAGGRRAKVARPLTPDCIEKLVAASSKRVA